MLLSLIHILHGEYKHLKKHCDLAAAMGVPRENMVIGEIGRVVELSPEQIALGGTVPSGSVMVDGLGVGDVGSIVLRDRKHLAQDGLIIVVVAKMCIRDRFWMICCMNLSSKTAL